MKIAIIDLDSVAYSAFNPNKVLDENGNPLRENNKFVYKDKTEEEIITSVDYCMNSILTQSKATHYIGYIKGKGNFRYEIDENYKGNRSKEEPKFWQFTKKQFIDRWKAVEVNGIEVDDAVHITYRALENSFIAAIDNDLMYLETIPNRPHYNWRKQEWITTSKEQAEYKFWYDMLVGQSGDGIKGLKGKGEKFAKKLLVGEYTNFRQLVAEAYWKISDDLAICNAEFDKNYGLLKILDSYEGFVIPEIVAYKNTTEENILNL